MSGRAHFEVYPERRLRSLGKQQWRWRLVAGNNKIVATSGEGFTRPEDAERACTDTTVTAAAVEWVGPGGSAVAVERVDS
jgi:uncharacterized protein YegP (UPF0339 family)